MQKLKKKKHAEFSMIGWLTSYLLFWPINNNSIKLIYVTERHRIAFDSILLESALFMIC
jgi:hypothetical protein